MEELQNGIQQKWTTVDNLIIDDMNHFDGSEKWVFVILLRYAFKVGSTAFPSQKTIARKVGVSDRQVRRNLNSLTEKGFLKKIGKKEETQTVIWRVEIPFDVQREWLRMQLEEMDNAGSDKKTKKVEGEKLLKSKIETNDDVLHKEIIEYLNKKSGKTFRSETKKTKELINKNLKLGYKLEDFKHVIDVKTEEWNGTSQEQFVRPSTLFAEINFESYRNQKPKTSKQPSFLPKQPQQQDKPKKPMMTEEERLEMLREAGIDV